jgi:16S rRNA (cytosine1402-N4)-methyltransferase
MIDGTVGDGGHAERFLDRYPSLALLAVDVDRRMLDRARRNLGRFGSRVQFEHGWFADVLARRHGPAQLMLLDLGVASYHFDRSGRGFSFRGSEPLDMRLSDQLARTAADILNEEPESALADLFHQFGEERHARRLARAIVRRRAERSFRTSDELEQVVWRVYPRDQRHRRIHPATRAFQALRIAVNDELQRLDQGLTVAIGRLAAGGRLGVIAFHSLEDRIVKQRLRDAAQRPGQAGGAAAVELLTRRPLRPGAQELQRNPRARSARLRVARKVAANG